MLVLASVSSYAGPSHRLISPPIGRHVCNVTQTLPPPSEKNEIMEILVLTVASLFASQSFCTASGPCTHSRWVNYIICRSTLLAALEEGRSFVSLLRFKAWAVTLTAGWAGVWQNYENLGKGWGEGVTKQWPKSCRDKMWQWLGVTNLGLGWGVTKLW